MSTTWINRGHFYNPHVRPVLVDCNFTVSSTSGEGIASLKGQGVSAVYMHSSSPAADNPNPAAGYIWVHLSDSFNRIYKVDADMGSPNSGTPILIDASDALLTIGAPYTITVVGDATAADWLAIGVPKGVTPAVGVSFIAKATGSGVSATSAVQAPLTAGSGIDHVETVGDPNLSLFPSPTGPSPNVGSWILLRCMLSNATATPANSSTIRLSFYMNQSNVLVAGE